MAKRNKQIAWEYQAGMSFDDMSILFELSHAQIERILKKLNIARTRAPHKVVKPKRATDEPDPNSDEWWVWRKTEIKRRYDAGENVRDIGEDFNIGPARIYQLMKELREAKTSAL